MNTEKSDQELHPHNYTKCSKCDIFSPFFDFYWGKGVCKQCFWDIDSTNHIYCELFKLYEVFHDPSVNDFSTLELAKGYDERRKKQDAKVMERVRILMSTFKGSSRFITREQSK